MTEEMSIDRDTELTPDERAQAVRDIADEMDTASSGRQLELCRVALRVIADAMEPCTDCHQAQPVARPKAKAKPKSKSGRGPGRPRKVQPVATETAAAALAPTEQMGT